jgi:hypothetical protein
LSAVGEADLIVEGCAVDQVVVEGASETSRAASSFSR